MSNQEQGTALKAFPWCKRCFYFTPDCLRQEFSYTCGMLWLSTGWHGMFNAAQAVATWLN